jgi:transcriptional regulator of heat shock response
MTIKGELMKNFKQILLSLTVIIALLMPSKPAKAQFIIGEVIKLTVTKIIKAIDLKVQRMQNKTIWLQNAQKVIENQLSKTKLTEISGWTEQQRSLYSDYYAELGKIKSVIAKYQRIKDITLKASCFGERV